MLPEGLLVTRPSDGAAVRCWCSRPRVVVLLVLLGGVNLEVNQLVGSGCCQVPVMAGRLVMRGHAAGVVRWSLAAMTPCWSLTTPHLCLPPSNRTWRSRRSRRSATR